ncbi:MAG: ATP-binding protein [Myxococcota bacterium]
MGQGSRSTSDPKGTGPVGLFALRGTDLVADRTRLIVIGAQTVIAAGVIFTGTRLASQLVTGQATPWWVNAASVAILSLLLPWFRAAPDRRSTVMVHATALVATVALIVPVAYGMTSSKWWLVLVGFGVMLGARRSEVLVWAPVTAILIPLCSVLEPSENTEGVIERALSGLAFALILMTLALLFRRVAIARAEKLRETALSLERSSRVRNRFLAHMSHEIRTPLHSVIALTDLSLNEEPNSPTSGYVRSAHEAAQTLLTLLNNLLDVTRVEADAIELVREPFDLHAGLRSVLSPLAARASAKGLGLTATAEPGIVTRRLGDGTRVQQLVLNVVANAIKFSERGTVKVHLRSTDQPEVFALEVRDEGVGIPEDRREDIFDPFVTIAPETEFGGGAGLGLSIVRSVARMMDGDAVVKSEVGVGSTFTITMRLPAAPDATTEGPTALLDPVGERSEEPDVEERQALQPRRVLICEDDPVNRRTLERMLQRLGHDTVSVEVGERAWELLSTANFDLLLTDVEMPGMSGTELTKKIRHREAERGGQRLTVIAATAHVGEEEQHVLLDAGVDAHLGKPFTIKHLREALARVDALPLQLGARRSRSSRPSPAHHPKR